MTLARLLLATLVIFTAKPLRATTVEKNPSADSRAASVNALVLEQMQAKRIPGLQIVVLDHEKPIFERSYGTANLQTPVPVTAETLFPINSITKAFSGVAVMKLVENGSVSLDSPISAYLADLPAAWRKVTIRQLLTHMSGIPDINNAPGASDLSAKEGLIWAWVTSQPMYFEPGERFSYCQTNYTLLQRLTNKFSGRPADAPIAGTQIREADMNHTRYGDSTEVIPNAAAAYRFVPARDSEAEILRPAIEVNLPFIRASRGMVSTADDMGKWIIALQQGRILTKASLATLWTPAAFNDGRVGEWGLGWEVLRRPAHRAVGMTGAGRSAFFIYPDDDLAVVILTNLSGAYPEDFIDQVAEIYGLKLTGMAALRVELERQNFQNGAAVLSNLRKDEPDFSVDEAELNDWGYRLLSRGEPKQALEALKLVAALYPRSGNAYDSLGEAYAAVKDRASAVASYRKSIELDPKNKNAVAQLRKLEAQPGAGR